MMTHCPTHGQDAEHKRKSYAQHLQESLHATSSKEMHSERACVRVLLQVLYFFQHDGYSLDRSGPMLPILRTTMGS